MGIQKVRTVSPVLTLSNMLCLRGLDALRLHGSHFSVQAPVRSNLYEPATYTRHRRAGHRLRTQSQNKKKRAQKDSSFLGSPCTPQSATYLLSIKLIVATLKIWLAELVYIVRCCSVRLAKLSLRHFQLGRSLKQETPRLHAVDPEQL